MACIWTHFFFLPRYAAAVGLATICGVGTTIISIGADINNLTETRKWVIIEWTVLCMRVFGWMWGVPYWSYSKPKVDYSKWLGPDWKPTYDGHTMIVSNHLTYIDIYIIFMYIRPMPGFIAKHSVKSVPSVGM